MPELFRRFPRLARTVSRVDLRVAESPLQWWTVDGIRLLIKRDDLDAPSLGGNKVRALEFLIAGVGPDQRLLTVGSTGSTHALTLAHYGARVGAPCEVITWPQEENAVSLATAARLETISKVTRERFVVMAYLRAALRRLRRDVAWVPAGGSSPLGALGHVNAALEVLKQLDAAGLPDPAAIVVPLGSGGTLAGLLVGLSVAEARIPVHGVRVVPAIVANRRRVLRLAHRTHRLLAARSGALLPPLDESLLHIDDSAYGGAYARETPESKEAAAVLQAASGPPLDGTYSAKAFGAALDLARESQGGTVLFWLTFDGRWLPST